MEPIHILVADDHALFRSGLRSLLASVPDTEVVGEAATGQEAVQQAELLQPDVVLMDIQMPGLNGIDATRRIVATSPHIGVIIVTMFNKEGGINHAIILGVSRSDKCTSALLRYMPDQNPKSPIQNL